MVFKGYTEGLIQGWERCSQSVQGFPSAVYLGYPDKQQAEIAWASRELEVSQVEGIALARQNSDPTQRFNLFEASLDVVRRSLSAAETSANLFYGEDKLKLEETLTHLAALHSSLTVIWTGCLEELHNRPEPVGSAGPVPVAPSSDDSDPTGPDEDQVLSGAPSGAPGFSISDSESESPPRPQQVSAQEASQIASTRLGQAREDLAATAERLEAAKAALEGDQADTPSDTPPKKQHYIPLATSLREIHQYSATVASDRASVAATDLAQAPVGQPSSDPEAAILAILKAKKQRVKNKKSKSKGTRSPPSSVSN